MSINVYAFPPCSLTGWGWTTRTPIQRSRSIIAGSDYMSQAGRKRRMAKLDVAGIGRTRMGAGYMESLIELLAGGQHGVRLYSMPINYRGRHSAADRQAARLDWTDSGTDLDWTDSGTEMIWYDGTILSGTHDSALTDSAGFPYITVSGLPANTLVARPSEFLTVFADEDDLTGTTVRIVTDATSDANGVAVIRLFTSPGDATDLRVNIGTRDTGVFRPVSIPEPMQELNANWIYDWEFYEVFADEVGSFTEIDPW